MTVRLFLTPIVVVSAQTISPKWSVDGTINPEDLPMDAMSCEALLGGTALSPYQGATGIHPEEGSFTFSTWVKYTKNDYPWEHQQFLGMGSNKWPATPFGKHMSFLRYTEPGSGQQGLKFEFYGNGDCNVQVDLQDGKWYHHAVVFSNKHRFTTIYVDGQPMPCEGGNEGNMVNLACQEGTEGSGVRVGITYPEGENYAHPMKSKLADAKIFNQALTSAQVAELASDLPGRSPPLGGPEANFELSGIVTPDRFPIDALSCPTLLGADKLSQYRGPNGIHPEEGSFTFSTWVKYAKNDYPWEHQQLLGMGSNKWPATPFGQSLSFLRYTEPGSGRQGLKFEFYGNGDCNFEVDLQDDQWYHHAVVFSNKHRFSTIYVDGQPLPCKGGNEGNMVNLACQENTEGSGVRVGITYPEGENYAHPLVSTLGDVKIFGNRALTQKQIQQLASAGPDGPLRTSTTTSTTATTTRVVCRNGWSTLSLSTVYSRAVHGNGITEDECRQTALSQGWQGYYYDWYPAYGGWCRNVIAPALLATSILSDKHWHDWGTGHSCILSTVVDVAKCRHCKQLPLDEELHALKKSDVVCRDGWSSQWSPVLTDPPEVGTGITEENCKIKALEKGFLGYYYDWNPQWEGWCRFVKNAHLQARDIMSTSSNPWVRAQMGATCVLASVAKFEACTDCLTCVDGVCYLNSGRARRLRGLV